MMNRTRVPVGRSHLLFRGLLVLTVLFGGGIQVFAQNGTPPPGEEVQLPPSNVGTDIPAAYNGVLPSSIDRQLIGPVLLLRAGTMDLDALTVTLPLYRGQMRDGQNVWYILTDTTDEGNANALGLNHSPKLAYAEIGRATRLATIEEDLTLTFEQGTVDFRPERRVEPGDAPNFFPPKVAEPGSVGDAHYTPIIKIQNGGGHVYNAPVVAFGVEAGAVSFCDGNPDYSVVHDQVTKICPEQGTVTLRLSPIFTFARPAAYMTTESSDAMGAAVGSATFTPALGDIPVGSDDGAFSAVERLFQISNGPMGADNPQRQGLNSTLGEPKLPNEEALPPLNVAGGIPTITLDYSPLWDHNLGEWTQEAIDKGYRARVNEEFQILELAQEGWLTGPGGEPFGSSGIVINCPIVYRFL